MSDEDDLQRDRSDHRPSEYWNERLAGDFSLRGVGHLSYSERYNEWIYRQKRRVLRPMLESRPGPRALDVGSGIGWVVEELTAAGLEVDGCDISPLAVERLRVRFPGCEFFTLELGREPIPRADATFDVATILDVTYHIVDDEVWAHGLAELARVLRPGGRLIVLDRFGTDDDDVAAHVRFRSRARWEDTASTSGLALDTIRPAYRWLSRERDTGPMRRLPSSARGALEFGLERLVPRAPHMRIARFTRSG